MKTSASCDYAIDGYKLQWSNCTGDLSAHIDIDLKFTELISNIVHIGHSCKIKEIIKCFHSNNPEVLVTDCFTYVRHGKITQICYDNEMR